MRRIFKLERGTNAIRAILFIFLLTVSRGSSQPTVLNDVHSKLNATAVAKVVYPNDTADVMNIVRKAKRVGKAISISGGKHAMGGQQFGEGTIHIDMSMMNDVLALDAVRGVVRVEAGIRWPDLVTYLLKTQEGSPNQWGIIQKQTGADQLSIGGAVSANAHGRGVHFKPFVQDIDSFRLVNAAGELLEVSREKNYDLFKLVVGGYGLFGVITTVDLRLQKRLKLERVVEILPIDELPDRAHQRVEAGFLYGDYQYKTDEGAEDFMKIGVFSCYKPVPDDAAIPENQQTLSSTSWNELIALAHTNKAKAFQLYSDYYLTTILKRQRVRTQHCVLTLF